MKVSAINANYPKVSFTDALSTKQEKQLNALMDRIETKENEYRQSRGDYKAPMQLAYVYPYAFPSEYESFDDGVGKINSPMAKRYFEIMKTYGGATAIQLPPLTQLSDDPSYNQNHSASPYKGAGLALNEAMIYLPNLANGQYGHLLTNEEVKEYTDTHKTNSSNQLGAIEDLYTNKIDSEAFIDLETPLGWKNQEDYPINKYLKKAYYRFLNEENKDTKLVELRKEFEEFKNQKQPVDYDKIYTRLALFPYIKDWATSKTDFFIGFDSNEDEKNRRIEQINAWWNGLDENRQNEISEAIDFYKFKQFICRKELQSAVKTIHSLGMEVYGDMLFGNSWVEEQVFPDAFKKRWDGARGEIGELGGLPAYNFEDLRDNPNSASSKFLKQKIAFNLDYFDGIRLDMGWVYLRPYYHFNHQYQDPVWVDTKITDFIANCAKEIKGNDFDTRKLMYECDADGKDFSIENFADLMKRTQGTMVLSTIFENEDNGSFGSYAYYKENLGFDDDKMIVTANTHDNPGVIELSDNPAKCSTNAGALQRTYRKREQDGVQDGWKMFKSDNDVEENRRLYIRGRLAEANLPKNNLITYLNLLGRRERLDYHKDGSIAGGFESAIHYKNRLQKKSEEWFHDALRASVAFNLPEIKLFNIENANKNPDGSTKVNYDNQDIEALRKYAKYLKRNTGINTRAQADELEQGNIDISQMNLDEI